MSLRPWSKFYWADWRADPRLRMCSLAARGLWVELCGLAHEANPYGHVLVAGVAPTGEQMASLVGAPTKVVQAAMKELELAGVFSRTSDGVIYSRRMVRDKVKQEVGEGSAGKRWGNGSPNRSPNGSPSHVPTGPPITLDTRSQNLEPEPNGSGVYASPDHEAPNDRKGKRTKRKTGIPADWRPDPDDCEFAQSLGFGPAATGELGSRYVDHWLREGDAKADWKAGWRTWVRNEIKFSSGRTAPAKPQPAEQKERDRAGIIAALAPGMEAGNGNP